MQTFTDGKAGWLRANQADNILKANFKKSWAGNVVTDQDHLSG
jgi:hypothetical protein